MFFDKLAVAFLTYDTFAGRYSIASVFLGRSLSVDATSIITTSISVSLANFSFTWPAKCLNFYY
jgi:hypothetical protein